MKDQTVVLYRFEHLYGPIKEIHEFDSIDKAAEFIVDTEHAYRDVMELIGFNERQQQVDHIASVLSLTERCELGSFWTM